MTTGTVESVFGPNDFGFYKLKVGGVWYGAGKKPLAVNRGDTVEFDSYIKDGKYATVKGDVRIAGAQNAQNASAPTQTTGVAIPNNAKPYVNAKDAYWEAKDAYDKGVVQPRITYLAAYERAIKFAELAFSKGAVDLAKVKDKDKLGVIEAFVDERTQKIIDAANAKPEATTAVVDSAPAANDEEWS